MKLTTQSFLQSPKLHCCSVRRESDIVEIRYEAKDVIVTNKQINNRLHCGHLAEALIQSDLQKYIHTSKYYHTTAEVNSLNTTNEKSGVNLDLSSKKVKPDYYMMYS